MPKKLTEYCELCGENDPIGGLYPMSPWQEVCELCRCGFGGDEIYQDPTVMTLINVAHRIRKDIAELKQQIKKS